MRIRISSLILSLAVSCLISNLAAETLTVKSVGSLRKKDQTQVTIVFSSVVDPATAAVAGNYTFPSGIAVTGASMMTGLPAATLAGNVENPPPGGRVVDNQAVILTVTGLNAGASSSVTVQNVKDTGGNALAKTTVNFTDSGYSYTDSGTPTLAGKVIAISTNGFDIFSAGVAQWANYDEVTLVTKQLTGDFELKARVEFQDFSSRWARAGIQARESLNEGENKDTQSGGTTGNGTASRYVSVHANPVKSWDNAGSGLINANNGFESHLRADTGGATTSSASGTPAYPNAWIRMVRTGDSIVTSRSDDGDKWEEMATRDVTGWNKTLFVGPAFGVETGNINAANPPDAKNHLFLMQLRFNKILTPLITSFTGLPNGFTLAIKDAATQLDPSSLQLLLNGAAVTPTSVTKSGDTTTITLSNPTPFTVGSTNTVSITFKDTGTPPVSKTEIRTFVSNFIAIPAEFAVSGVDTSKRGFKVRMHQLDSGQPNSNARSEQELFGELGPNVADLSAAGADGFFTESDVINYDKDGDASNNGNFNAPDFPDKNFPGIPGTTGSTENFAAELITFIEFPQAGTFTMGVNSDDGFRTSTGLDFRDRFQSGTVRLGEFDGGRGAADTIFQFFVPKAGTYPFRTTYEQGGGGANLEWFTVTPDGKKILLNDSKTAGALRTFTTGPLTGGPAFVKSVRPSPDSRGVDPKTDFQIVIQDAATKVVAGSVKLQIDGAAVTPTVTQSGGTTTVALTPATPSPLGKTHTVTFSFDQTTSPVTTRTNTFTFQTRLFSPSDLPANSFWIEAEDFNFDGGKTKPDASKMPYAGGAYDSLGAILGIDYVNNDNQDSTAYRDATQGDLSVKGQGANITDNLGGQFGKERPGNFTMTANFRIGWVDSSDWCNYTRDIPNGVYKAFAALSFDGTSAHQLHAVLSKVTAGATTKNQTVVDLGTFDAPGSGGWGKNNLVPMQSPNGSDAVFKLGGTTTLRFTMGSGDFDWFVLVPTVAPPSVSTASPAPGSLVKRNTALNFTIADGSTQVAVNSIKLVLDSADVTSKATITKTADGATVSLVPATIFDVGSTHTAVLTFSDSGTPPATQSFTNTFTANVLGSPGEFLIEAEDFDFGGGQTKPEASTMPYLGGAFNGLSATFGVDYHNDDSQDSTNYRNGGDLAIKGEGANINGNDGDRDRGAFSVTSNFKIGWVNDGDWQNYTRTIPNGTYQVWVAQSYDDLNTPHRLMSKLGVVTAGVGTTNQTVQALGSFDAPGTAGWGVNRLVPMTDDSGSTAVVSLGGKQTLQWAISSGDADFFVLIPAAGGPPPGPKLSVSLSSGKVSIQWTGNATLQSADKVTGPWTAVANAASPFTASPTGKAKFYRLKQ